MNDRFRFALILVSALTISLAEALREPEISCGQTIDWSESYEAARPIPSRQRLLPGQAPWMVKIKIRGRAKHCSGVIVSDKYVLTLADCLVDDQGGEVSPSDVKVTTANRQTLTACKLALHPNYGTFAYTQYDNLGLIQLQRRLEWQLDPQGRNSINRICVPEETKHYPEYGQEYMTSLWEGSDLVPTHKPLVSCDKWKHLCFPSYQGPAADPGAPLYEVGPVDSNVELAGIALKEEDKDKCESDCGKIKFVQVSESYWWLNSKIR